MEVRQFLHYSTYEKIGEGINGTVFKAWDTRQHRIVALKVLRPPATPHAGMTRHGLIRSQIGLDHPNLAQIHRLEEIDGEQVIVMEHIEGLSLKDILLHRRHHEHDLLTLTRQISAGLRALHINKLIHGNLKPTNIMIDSGGVIKLLDAGLNPFRGYHFAPEFVSPFEALHYLAPEQIRAETISERTDLFSLGIVLYQMATGRLPFEGKDEDAVTGAILNDSPDFTRLDQANLTRDLYLLIKKLLNKNPFERITGSAELAITADEMAAFRRNEVTLSDKLIPAESPRAYLMIAALVLLLIIFWLVVTS